MKYINGKIEIGVHELLENLMEDKKQELVESLACDCDVIKFVTQQIIDGCTDYGYFGTQCCSADATPRNGLDWAHREVAKASSEVAKKEIEALEKELAYLNKKFSDLANERAQERY